MFGIKIIREKNQGLVTQFGKYKKTLEAGIHFYIPIIQHVKSVSLALTPLSLEPYIVITKDNAEVQAGITLQYNVTDARKYAFNNTDSVEAMVQLVRGHLRDIIGKKDLNETLGATSEINRDLQEKIGDLNNTYGIHVITINVDQLKPSKDIQESMDKQIRADRERVAAISKANGESESIRITTEANNNALVSTATAKATAVRTQADAEQYRINIIQAALSDVDDKYLQNKSIEAYQELANSKANLVVVPNAGSSDFGQTAVLGKMLNQENK